MLPTRSRTPTTAIAPRRLRVFRGLAAAVSTLLIPLLSAAGSPDATTEAEASKPANGRVENQAEQATRDPAVDGGEEADRVALTTLDPASRTALKPDFGAKASRTLTLSGSETPMARAILTITDCQARFDKVQDYTCKFYKRERVNGVLSTHHVMDMKVRNEPHSVYLKFHQPNRGREAIYVAGRNDGLVLAHDVGFTKLLAGTMRLDPRGARAMEGNRHPITDAGIGKLIHTIKTRWTQELESSDVIVLFNPRLKLGSANCLLVEAIHPRQSGDFYFHKVRLFINTDLGFPVRFEGYDWPKSPSHAPELVEEYIYDDIKINVGLSDKDFDVANELYSFGRF